MPNYSSYTRSMLNHDDAGGYEYDMQPAESFVGGELYEIDGRVMMAQRDAAHDVARPNNKAAFIHKAEEIQLPKLAADDMAIGDDIFFDPAVRTVTLTNTAPAGFKVGVVREAAGVGAARVWAKFDGIAYK